MTNSEWIKRKLLNDEITVADLYCSNKINHNYICTCQSQKCDNFSYCGECLEDWLNQEKEYLIFSCPFCNFTEPRIGKDHYADMFCVICDYCGAHSGYHETEESAVESWNSIRREKENDKF